MAKKTKKLSFNIEEPVFGMGLTVFLGVEQAIEGVKELQLKHKSDIELVAKFQEKIDNWTKIADSGEFSFVEVAMPDGYRNCMVLVQRKFSTIAHEALHHVLFSLAYIGVEHIQTDKISDNEMVAYLTGYFVGEIVKWLKDNEYDIEFL